MTTTIVPESSLLDNLLDDTPVGDLHELMAAVLERIMQYDVANRTGAAHYERTASRTNHRNGTRPRRFDTRLGTFDLQIPRLREGGYMPAFLEHRSRSEKALVGAVLQAIISGVSTRKIEKLAAQLGIASLSKSQASSLCDELDERVAAFRERRLAGKYPYLMLDALYEKVRIDGKVITQAVVIAYGVNVNGKRELLGVDVVETESYESWSTFLKGLLDRGLHGTKLVISDAHGGLVKAIAVVMNGVPWQRCKVHFMRNVLAHVPNRLKEEVAGAVKSIFFQPTKDLAMALFRSVVAKYKKSCQRSMQILEDGVEDTLAFMAFPETHRRKIASTNPIEHLNRDIRRRTRSVGIFPTRDSAIRLISMILLEQTEDWQAEKAYINSESLVALYASAADDS